MGIEAKELKIGYGDKIAIEKASLKIEDGEIVSIIGPNGSGKSTLIKALSRYLKPTSGKVLLDGVDLSTIDGKELAKKIAVLPQFKTTPDDISVETLVSYGRHPHLGFGKRLKKEDLDIMDWALEKTGLSDFKDRNVMTLSGGESQRAWIAMALTQKASILILDEPNTYLDISYQMEVLELVKELNKTLGLTVVMVLHDLNQAARYSDKIYVLMNGMICKYGKPKSVIQSELLRDVFRIEANVFEDSINSCPYFIPNKIV
jgi:iron complex transport system ATP-binding protein